LKWVIPSIVKRYAAPLLLALFVGAVGLSGWQGYQIGKKVERSNQAEAMAELRAKSEGLADELEAERAKRQRGTRVEVRYVDRAPDPSGCLDAPVLDDRMFDTLGGRDG
jgi:hypothetical protein